MEGDGSCPPGDGVPMPLRPGEVVPPASDEFELVCDTWSAAAHMAREHARQAAAIAELARRRSVERDAATAPAAGRGRYRAARPAALADVSDDFVSELATIRNCSEAEVGRLAAELILLTTTLAATWAEMSAGRLSIRKVRILLDLLGDASDAVAAAHRGLSGRALASRSRQYLLSRARRYLLPGVAELRGERPGRGVRPAAPVPCGTRLPGGAPGGRTRRAPA
ncbi:hypothetical protein [Blastococcus sp. SYSU DS0533]